MSVNQTSQHKPETSNAITIGFGLSYAITSVFSALLVVLKESNEEVHSVLAAITGHHWVTHGLLDIIVFLVLGFVFHRICDCSRMKVASVITFVVGSTVLSSLIIAGYFI
ncbi:hypothetical protein LIA75_004030 [Vibrio fluvialis]|uniref:hypothetical protein n=1 Tax=Vibrio fluvialis TaxID=676 RepID=UPI001404B703|nr:hypothetical protein [Vibrio fluvialis]EKO3492975.1 hypothetical protein [Vibrio fluvialis]ELS8950055.1 hypothetical protein [Vibrio fluvialis]MCG6387219.1 hypothetical protein [Vibrio fluvialis]NHN74284.1 hypothetical protein [Vibrio fluvialis]